MLTNKCMFLGTIFKISSVEMTNSGKKTCRATLSARVGKDSEGKGIYEYVPLRAYEQRAELLVNYFPKGKAISVETHYHGYKGQDGSWHYEFIVDDLTFVPSDYVEETAPQQPTPQPQQQQQLSPYAQQTFANVKPDDLPF